MPQAENFMEIQGAHPVVYYTVTGFPFNHATQAGAWGIAKMIEWDCPPISRNDRGGEPYADAKEIKLKIEALQNNYDGIKRAFLLAQALQDIIFQYGVDYYNFVAPYSLGCEVTLDVSSTDIVLVIEYHGKVKPSEWDAILDAAGSAAAGGAGTGSIITGLTQELFDDDEYGIPGIEKIYVGTGDVDTDDELGLKEAGGSKMQIKLAKIGDTMRLQPIVRKIEIKNTIAMFQNRADNLATVETWRNSEKVITWILWNGVTFVFDKCTKIVGGPKYNDNTALVELKNEGGSYLDAINTTPTNVIFDDTNKKITIHKQGAVMAP